MYLFFSRGESVDLAEQLTTYKLIWADEFENSELDLNNWEYRYIGPRRKGVNTKEAVTVSSDGYLKITTKKDASQYSTGMIGTKKLFEARYGYFEAKVFLPKEIGHWPAFWLQSRNMGKYIGEPSRAGVEVDIFEYLRKEGNVIRHAIHWDGYKDDHKSQGERVSTSNISDGWHTIGLLWTKNEYKFYIDGQLTWKTDQAVSQYYQYIILSLEVGDWAGNIEDANLPDSFLVDYVRVYQQSGSEDVLYP